MERWIAIILGLLVIVVGFVVVQNITDNQREIVDVGTGAECVVYGGSCTENCGTETLDYACPQGQTCCLRRG